MARYEVPPPMPERRGLDCPDDWPVVRMGTPESMRGLEADVVVVDDRRLSKGSLDLATTRARKRLVIVRG